MNSKINEQGQVSDKWIRVNRDIDLERKSIFVSELTSSLEDELDLQPNKKITTSEYQKLITTALWGFDDVRFSYGGETLLYQNVTRPENDEEVFCRLKAEEITKRKDEAFERKERKEYERLKAKYETDDIIEIAVSVPVFGF